MASQRALRHPALILFMLAVMVFFQLPAFSQDDTELPSDQESADDSSSSSSDSSTSSSSSDSSTTTSTASDDSSTTAATSSSTDSSSSTSSASDTGKKLADVFKNIISIIQQVFDIFSKLIQAIFGGDTATTGTGTTGTATTGTTGTTTTGSTDTGSTSTSTSTDTGTTTTGALQDRVAAEAAKLANKPFKYAAGTNGGRKGCAQVVTTALKAAGVVGRVVLGVLDAISDLKAKGWKEVKVPPFAKGDVITWKTYDRNGDGAKDADTHIGIIMTSGNTAQAMSNSSSLLMPRYNSANYQPISRVLRKA
ncbi:MAG: hypothetical protein GX442_12405 [Candidatus Riflebacteria bacterium]|nr:hypothetical protein [Candidatus Riflebacteria bacterium]